MIQLHPPERPQSEQDTSSSDWPVLWLVLESPRQKSQYLLGSARPSGPFFGAENEKTTPVRSSARDEVPRPTTTGPQHTQRLTFGLVGQRQDGLVQLHLLLLLTLLLSQVGVGVVVTQAGSVLVALPAD